MVFDLPQERHSGHAGAVRRCGGLIPDDSKAILSGIESAGADGRHVASRGRDVCCDRAAGEDDRAAPAEGSRRFGSPAMLAGVAPGSISLWMCRHSTYILAS